MCAASAMVEIINYAGTQQPQPELFELLRGCLFTLCSGTPPKALLALFIARLLKISGYLPEIEYCISCGSKAEYFIPGEGGICRKCAQKTGTAGLIMLESQTPVNSSESRASWLKYIYLRGFSGCGKSNICCDFLWRREQLRPPASGNTRQAAKQRCRGLSHRPAG